MSLLTENHGMVWPWLKAWFIYPVFSLFKLLLNVAVTLITSDNTKVFSRYRFSRCMQN